MLNWLKARVASWEVFFARLMKVHKSITIRILALQGTLISAHQYFPMMQQWMPQSTYSHIMEVLTGALVVARIITTQPLDSK